MTNSSFENNIGIIGLGVLGSAIAENFINKNISINAVSYTHLRAHET